MNTNLPAVILFTGGRAILLPCKRKVELAAYLGQERHSMRPSKDLNGWNVLFWV